ncbi:MAG: glycosyltransferase [Patescibacteria group bacterium]|jgi:dolichol-phosphate mannosyltransferase
MISFIFPAYNEAENLKRIPTEVLPVFDALGEPYEIIVIDDGSRKDNTAEVAASLGGRVRLVKHEVNRGLGAAVRTGIKEAKGDLVITMDTDLTFAPTLVKDLLDRYRKGDVDVVSGSPKMASYDKSIPFYRVAVSYAASFIYATVMGKWMRDVSPIFRLYKREQIANLPLESDRFGINAEILFFLIRDKRRIVEIPAPLTQRILGESNLDYKKEIVRQLKLVGRMLVLRVTGHFKKMTVRDYAWWVGVPVVMFVVAWLPFWIWNIAAGSPLANEWWRVRIAPQGVFDSYIYFQWLGSLLLGYEYGNRFQWLGGVFRALQAILPNGTTVLEFWLITRWICATLAVWIGSWCVARWSGLGVSSSRFMMVGLWVGLLLTLSFRPGVFGWYWPFCMLGLTLCLLVAQKLQDRKWLVAAALSVVGIFLSSLYPWFFLFAGMWLGVMWSIAIIKKNPRLFTGLMAGGIALFAAASPKLALWFHDPAHLGKIEAEVRNGIAFSHVPFLANTIVLAFVWILFVAYIVYQRSRLQLITNRFFLILMCWVTLFFVWFHSIFTGIFTHNDHFSAPILMVAWLSLAAVWSASRNTEMKWNKKIAWIVAIFGSAFFLYVLQQPLRGNILKFNTYVIHLVNWYTFAAAGWLIVTSGRWSVKRQAILLIALPVTLVGAIGWWSVVAKDMPTLATIKNRLPIVSWINANVKAPQTLCAEPESAAFYGAITGYPVLPGEGPIAYPIPTETTLRQLEVIAGALDVKAAGHEKTFAFFTSYYRDRLCRQFARQAGVLSRFGFSQEKVDEIIGCPREEVLEMISRTQVAIEKHQLDEQAFTEMCPFVIVEPNRKQFWNLPRDYREVTFSDGTAVWVSSQPMNQ